MLRSLVGSEMCIRDRHSRGGPIVLVQASNDPRVTHLVSWASVSTFDYAWKDPKKLDDWKRNGVMYRVNSRTKVAMPLYYQFYDNYLKNQNHLDTITAAHRLKKPWFIAHGTADEAVSDQAAKDLHAWSNDCLLYTSPSPRDS